MLKIVISNNGNNIVKMKANYSESTSLRLRKYTTVIKIHLNNEIMIINEF